MKKISFCIFHRDNLPLQKQTCICTDDVLKTNISIVERVAYNGKYTVEDLPDEDAPTTNEERIAELEEALALLLSGEVE